MKLREEEPLTVAVKTNRNHEVLEMHLFDEEAGRENALCGAASSAIDRRGVRGYLEDRRHGNSAGAVCEGCKAPAVPFAEMLSRDLEAEGLPDEAEEYRRLADGLARETGRRCTGG